MRTPSATCVVALLGALLQGSHALNAAALRKFNLMADMGYDADGMPMALDTSHLDRLRKQASTGGVSGEFLAASKPSASAEKIVAEYVTLPLDHFSKEEEENSGYEVTFKNRYWVAESGYRPGGPVFLYDVGEADAGPNALFRLQNSTSFFKQLVDEFGGIGIVWEHRFYGNSTPEPINLDTPAEAFEFLTTEQSLADVDRFAKQFKRKNINTTLTPDQTPWVFVGGSYPAMRAVFMRNKYPDTIFASYASSAPVQASVDQSFYFDPIFRGMNSKGFGNCSRDIQSAVRYIDTVMDSDQDAAARLKEQFLGLGAANNSHAGFADALTTTFNLWQSYGMEGGSMSLRALCDWIETEPKTNQTAPAEGFAKEKGPKYTVARWADFPNLVQGLNTYMDTNCSGKANVTGDCNLQLRSKDPATIAWSWQYCTEWGFFQSANLGPNQLVSKYNSLQHQHDICHRQFPNASPSLLPDWPLVNRTNHIFGGWHTRPSNTYWSNGEFDPWRTLSPASAEPFAPKVNVFSDPVPECGKEQAEDELFGYVLQDAEHCFDFRTTGVTVPGGVVSRGLFTSALRKWLPCFTGARKGMVRRWRA